MNTSTHQKVSGAKKTYSCGLEAALAVVGGKWKSLILWNLAQQPCRFGELRRLVVGVSEKMLIQELKEFMADRIITRKDFHEVPPRVEYALTEFGHSLVQTLKPLCQWGTRHMKLIAALPTQTVLPKPQQGLRNSSHGRSEG
jgi:DNA-binding HxlR family transcriptional regulator